MSFGDPAQLAIAVHPRVQAFDRPPLAGLDRCWCALGGDLGLVAEDLEQVAGLARVVAAVQMHSQPVRQWSDHVVDPGQGSSSGESWSPPTGSATPATSFAGCS